MGKVTAWLEQAADDAVAGDTVLVTFAGHGDQVDDYDGDELRDQALVLYDNLLVDDAIYRLLERFKERVRVFFVFDCCYGESAITYLMRWRRPPPLPALRLRRHVRIAAIRTPSETAGQRGCPASLRL